MVFANEDAYAANDPLKDNTKLKRYGKSMTKALVVVIGPIENVLTAFECPCIFALHLEETGDIKNYEAWKDEGVNKKSRPLPVILSGPGTGKSRMLIEMKKLLDSRALLNFVWILITGRSPLKSLTTIIRSLMSAAKCSTSSENSEKSHGLFLLSKKKLITLHEN
ncbi:hypothetical protein Ae201684_000036 [Aphanomyces euteiches]|uniref:Uncharacterized protein n=1 Tax=Aphanomyces euteiches TaxID=100861 RepID=A0A6G0XXV4_9STRA|nr:hypothetical protein Ae201684_000036 [Aphanomyces euteiches]